MHTVTVSMSPKPAQYNTTHKTFVCRGLSSDQSERFCAFDLERKYDVDYDRNSCNTMLCHRATRDLVTKVRANKRATNRRGGVVVLGKKLYECTKSASDLDLTTDLRSSRSIDSGLLFLAR